ncbi:sporulation protein YjcZ [Cohnella sp. CBP 2801]|uniref:Sporulation protein YjcZ n=1 Tax=Cohnella zeiphila TaxID=2761120 RepID=A0A7X0SRW0_9BACL|nr:sporulation protein YjcZ [Cohnella zeiphila]MBB6735002.1 sporulation protein YjcZ [Cohnella zeiphila]
MGYVGGASCATNGAAFVLVLFVLLVIILKAGIFY